MDTDSGNDNDHTALWVALCVVGCVLISVMVVLTAKLHGRHRLETAGPSPPLSPLVMAPAPRGKHVDQGPPDDDLQSKMAEVLADQSGSLTDIFNSKVLGDKRGTARPLFNVDDAPDENAWDSEFDLGSTAKVVRPEDDVDSDGTDDYTDIAPIRSSYIEINADAPPDECLEFDNGYTHIGQVPQNQYVQIDNEGPTEYIEVNDQRRFDSFSEPPEQR